MKFAISVPSGYVAGFSNQYVCVQTCDKANAKQFASRVRAQQFIDKYGDAGFGLLKNKASIVLLESERLTAPGIRTTKLQLAFDALEFANGNVGEAKKIIFQRGIRISARTWAKAMIARFAALKEQ
jgi:hypothetical protein